MDSIRSGGPRTGVSVFGLPFCGFIVLCNSPVSNSPKPLDKNTKDPSIQG